MTKKGNTSNRVSKTVEAQFNALKKGVNALIGTKSPAEQARIRQAGTDAYNAAGGARKPEPAAPAPYTPLNEKNQYTPYQPTTSGADKYYQTLLSSLVPTQRENQLQDQATALDSKLRNLNQGQGVMNANIEDQPIALPFITGQLASVERRYALQRGDVQNQQMTLQQQLANEQARRQAAIDVAKVGVDYGRSQDSRADSWAQNNFANQFNVNKMTADEQQRALDNQNYSTKYRDMLKQQEIENQMARSRLAIEQQNANRLLAQAGKGSNDEEKDIQKFYGDAASYIEQLGMNKISWGTAFNALKAKYPQASNELIDQILGKDRYYNVNPQ